MKLIVAFTAYGLDPVPWSVPYIGNGKNAKGKRYRFATRAKKDNLGAGSASLATWQKFVADAATKAMAGKPPVVGSVFLYIAFLARTPEGKEHGDIWEVPLKTSKTTGELGKSQPRGKPEPDLTNMVKAAEDAIEEVIFHDDVQVRAQSTETLYGPMPGIMVEVYAMGVPESDPGKPTKPIRRRSEAGDEKRAAGKHQ